MKRRLLIVLLFSLLAVGGVAAWRWWPRLFPSGEVGELYRRYESSEHVRASYIRGFRVNDTLRLDVTTLQARDSVGWERLKEDFHIPPLTAMSQGKVESGIDIISLRNVPKTDPSLPADTVDVSNNNVMAISRLHHTVSIFYTRTEAEQTAIFHNQVEIGLSNPQNQPK